MARKKTEGVCTSCGEFCYALLIDKDNPAVRRCPPCETSFQKYEAHWFTRSIRYKKPALKPPRRKKPLPGQQDLFEHGPVE